jgi:hypothetical protein
MWEFSAMPYDPRPAQAARLKMFHLIADKIERDPAWLQKGLDNIARWIANGSRQPGSLREDSERAEFFRNFALFAGALDTKERRTVSEISPFAH